MKTSTLEAWVWVLIYGGLLTMALGIAVKPTSPNLAFALCAGGAGVAVLGAVLIYVRSRIKGP